jgi:hypothetical protein
MKKMYFKTMVILMAVALATGATSCDKDDEEDVDLFTPSPNLSSSEIEDLLNEAMENTLAVSSISVTGEEGDDDEDGGR